LSLEIYSFGSKPGGELRIKVRITYLAEKIARDKHSSLLLWRNSDKEKKDCEIDNKSP
jgi:hypothetical protein